MRVSPARQLQAQLHLALELSMHNVPLLWRGADVDALSTAFAGRANTAACETTPLLVFLQMWALMVVTCCTSVSNSC